MGNTTDPLGQPVFVIDRGDTEARELTETSINAIFVKGWNFDFFSEQVKKWGETHTVLIHWLSWKELKHILDDEKYDGYGEFPITSSNSVSVIRTTNGLLHILISVGSGTSLIREAIFEHFGEVRPLNVNYGEASAIRTVFRNAETVLGV